MQCVVVFEAFHIGCASSPVDVGANSFLVQYAIFSARPDSTTCDLTSLDVPMFTVSDGFTFGYKRNTSHAYLVPEVKPPSSHHRKVSFVTLSVVEMYMRASFSCDRNNTLTNSNSIIFLGEWPKTGAPGRFLAKNGLAEVRRKQKPLFGLM